MRRQEGLLTHFRRTSGSSPLARFSAPPLPPPPFPSPNTPPATPFSAAARASSPLPPAQHKELLQIQQIAFCQHAHNGQSKHAALGTIHKVGLACPQRRGFWHLYPPLFCINLVPNLVIPVRTKLQRTGCCRASARQFGGVGSAARRCLVGLCNGCDWHKAPGTAWVRPVLLQEENKDMHYFGSRVKYAYSV